jgi:hypothetical protein
MKLGQEHYDYLFHYNSYTGKWNAFTRENKEAYFNGEHKEEDGLLSSTSLKEIVEAITILKG